ncbi:hypothetical protein I4F81_007720 [Pyropia yezoensis]|uniref:Uncharacterized protein n=1 Tax=Pyropia yezoensis TaxID=2788 RepID=A0ACC3C4Q7_PYRYE|nr:hypothetical protein I4F81_007720 [Neopyropia yezoensis]|eukprot:contig_18818_g4627
MDTDPSASADSYTYKAAWPVYGVSLARRRDSPFRVVVSSFVEQYANQVQVIDLVANTSPPPAPGSAAPPQPPSILAPACTLEHPYPATKVDWIPDEGGVHPSLVATTGDFLRIWDVSPGGGDGGNGSGVGGRGGGGAVGVGAPPNPPTTGTMKCLLTSNTASEYCAPLTAFDWNEVDVSLIGTSSIDTTCTVWDVTTQQSVTQLIAHDAEVYDFAFAVRSTNVFASVGADGSVRLFDLRSLEHSTIVYEAPDAAPLLRLRWNAHDPNYLAAVVGGSPDVVLLDIRVPSTPIATLRHGGGGGTAEVAPGGGGAGATGGGSTAMPGGGGDGAPTDDRPPNSVNALCWAPHSAAHLLSVSDGGEALIWDVSRVPASSAEPVLSYDAGGPVNNGDWSAANVDYCAVAVGSEVQLLRV